MNPRNLKIADFHYPLPEERIALYPLPERDSSKLLIWGADWGSQYGVRTSESAPSHGMRTSRSAPSHGVRTSRSASFEPEGLVPKKIQTDIFRNIGNHLPKDTLLIFNDTKVVRARLVFYKAPAETALAKGARIEIFVLEPVEPADIAQAFSDKSGVKFKCLVGNNKKWKDGPLYMDFPLAEAHTPYGARTSRSASPTGESEGRASNKSEGRASKGRTPKGRLEARRLEAIDEAFLIEFTWQPAELSFAEVLEAAGRVPLPPYIHREAEDSDTLRYQTVFARHDGSVAAPTAGLHFTEAVLKDLSQRGIRKNFVTLHVGAGTFKPVKSEEVGGHLMHRETITATRALIEDLLRAVHENRPVIPVGTTSMRTLESLYWVGVRIMDGTPSFTQGRGPGGPRSIVRGRGPGGPRSIVRGCGPGGPRSIEVHQWDPYEDYAEARKKITPEQSLLAILAYMDEHQTDHLQAHTALMIAPGYEFAFCRGLVTNFHQPQSTLLLLVCALIGPVWRQVYDYALQNNFRFLSYGDSCLFIP